MSHKPKDCLTDCPENQARFRLIIGLMSFNCLNDKFRREFIVANR